MKFCLVQKHIQNSDYLSLLADVAALQPDWVAFGELGTTGCLYEGGSPFDPEQLRKEFAAYQFAITIGLPRQINGRMRNSYMYYYQGEISYYDKINLFPPMNEDKVFEAGNEPVVLDSPFGKVGLAICYDIRFPELFQHLKNAGAEMIMVPAAFPQVRIMAWRDLLKERAKETGLPVIGINCVGDDGTNVFGGTTMVVNGEGEIIVQADEINESIIEVEL